MRYSAVSVLTFAAAAVAQTAGFDAITTPPATGSSIAAGSTFEIDWDATTHLTDTVSIILLGGASPATLQPVSTIASQITNSVAKFSWSVPATLGSNATYGFKIVLDTDATTFQYSFPFAITGGTVSSSTSSSSSSADGTSTTTSASASTTASAPPTTTTTAAATTTATATVTTVPVPGNLSTSGTPPKTTITSIVSVSASKTASGSASVSTGAASQMGSNAAALMGGLALAVLAL